MNQADPEHKPFEFVFSKLARLDINATITNQLQQEHSNTPLKTYFIRPAITRKNAEWTGHVQKQLAKGGGKLFKYIIQED